MAWSQPTDPARRGQALLPNVPASVFAEREAADANAPLAPPASLSPSARMRQFGVAPEGLSDEPLLGRYRILELRDVGGFGSVLVCWDVRLQRRVAVKCMPLELGASAVTLDEALAEARASSFLAHPNIVTVHDFEVEGSWAYLVMEYVDGVTLAELQARVEGGVLVFDEAAYVAQCLASALSFAHANGVLHLDIKPQNVLIDRTGQVKLGDFGMASLASAAGWGGARGGTVGYMAPEQLEGELVDERSDVFSLACMLYEAICGIAPFRAQTAEASGRLIEKGARAIDELEDELDPSIAAAIMAALSPDAAARPSSVAAFANVLLGGSRGRAAAASGTVAGQPGTLPALENAGYAAPRPALGDPARGLASIRQLMDQTAEDAPALADENLAALDPPGRRLPLLAGVLARTSAAVCAFVVLALAGPAFGFAPEALPDWSVSWPYLVVCGIAAALSAVWPPLGAAFGIASVAVAVLADGLSPATLALALATIAAGGAWWILFGRRGRLASAAFLAPAALLCPLCAPGLAGYALRPLAAFATGALAPAFAELVCAAMENSWAGEATALALAARFSAPGVWVLMAATGTGALAASLLTLAAAKRKQRSWLAFEMQLESVPFGSATQGATSAFGPAEADDEDWDAPLGPRAARRPSTGRVLAGLGQAFATGAALAGEAFARSLENGGIYSPPATPTLVVALAFFGLMVFVVGLFGPAEEPLELERERRSAGARSTDEREGARP